MPSLADRIRERGVTAAVVCMMCGRTVGQFQHGRVYVEPTRQTIRREGRQLRCGYCHGNVYLDVDPGVLPERVDEAVEEPGNRRSRSA